MAPVIFVNPPVQGLPAGALIDYDASDISSLWQNDGRSTPVTANLDTVAAIDNLGSGTANVNTGGTSTQEKTYRTDLLGGGGNPWVEATDSETNGLTGTWVEGMADADITFFIVFLMTDLSTFPTAEGMMNAGGKAGRIDMAYGSVPDPTASIEAGVFFDSDDAPGGGQMPEDTAIAFWAQSNGDLTGFVDIVRWSWVTGTHGSTFELASGVAAGETIRIFTRATVPPNHALGKMVIWDRILTAEELTTIEGIATSTWGVAWS